jgi:Zn ribbon nucleic-acid-binding protein
MLRSDADPVACQSADHLALWVDCDMVDNHENSLTGHPKKK